MRFVVIIAKLTAVYLACIMLRLRLRWVIWRHARLRWAHEPER